MNTLLLDRTTWDLVVDAARNIAVASDPYSKAQDVASACRLFQGELYYDTASGVPYFGRILGKLFSPAFIKAQYRLAAQRVDGVANAQCFLDAVTDRVITGQVQFNDESGNTLVVPVGTPTPPPPVSGDFILGESTLGGTDVL